MTLFEPLQRWLKDFTEGDRRKTYGGVTLTVMMAALPWTMGPSALGPVFDVSLYAVATLAALASGLGVIAEVESVRRVRLLEDAVEEEELAHLLRDAKDSVRESIAPASSDGDGCSPESRTVDVPFEPPD